MDQRPASPLPATPCPEPVKGGVWRQVCTLLDMIKFEHTLFALPFALLGALSASPIWPGWAKLGWIVLAMVGARTAAMTFNRLIDADIDGENPRTAQRAIPAKKVSVGGAMALMGAGIVAFGYAAGRLGPLPWKLAPWALAAILGYSLCKRFTSFSHLFLGLALAIAPAGAWIAIAGRMEDAPLSLSLGVFFWVAGFDILYALQDREFDKKQGLYSIPARFGVKKSLYISRIFHVLALLFWADFNMALGVHLFPWVAWVAVAVMLFREQWIMRKGQLEHLNHAFFTLNSLVGVVFFVGHFVEYVMYLREL